MTPMNRVFKFFETENASAHCCSSDKAQAVETYPTNVHTTALGPQAGGKTIMTQFLLRQAQCTDAPVFHFDKDQGHTLTIAPTQSGMSGYPNTKNSDRTSND